MKYENDLYLPAMMTEVQATLYHAQYFKQPLQFLTEGTISLSQEQYSLNISINKVITALSIDE